MFYLELNEAQFWKRLSKKGFVERDPKVKKWGEMCVRV